MIGTSLTQRLARDGIRAEKECPTYFRLKFAEEAGDELPIYERQSRWDFRGQDTGQTATEAKGSLIVELIVPGRDKPIWRETLSALSSRSYDGDINDATVRKSMLESLGRQISLLSFPYYIPESEDLPALPLVIE